MSTSDQSAALEAALTPLVGADRAAGLTDELNVEIFADGNGGVDGQRLRRWLKLAGEPTRRRNFGAGDRAPLPEIKATEANMTGKAVAERRFGRQPAREPERQHPEVIRRYGTAAEKAEQRREDAPPARRGVGARGRAEAARRFGGNGG